MPVGSGYPDNGRLLVVVIGSHSQAVGDDDGTAGVLVAGEVVGRATL